VPTWVPECLHWPFCPGVFIAILAFVAAAVTFRKEPGPREKAIWIFLFLSLMSAEVWMVSVDRRENIQKQKETREDEIARFKAIGEGIQSSMVAGQAHFDATMSGINQNVSTITGGNSFCYLAIAVNGEMPTFIHNGSYPLSSVNARIVDMQKWHQAIDNNPHPSMQDFMSADSNVFIGDVPPHTALPRVGVVQLAGKTEAGFNIFFNARNGFWTQELRLRLVDGKWLSATRVTRMEVGNKRKNPKALYEKIDKDFPRTSKGEVDWR
jgi:hypothetical protein